MAINNSNLRSFLIRGMFGSGSLRVIQAVAVLVTSVVLARLLGPEDFGIYTFILSIVTVLAIPAQLGLPILVMREVAKFMHTNELSKIKGVFRFANTLAIISIFVVIMVVLLSLFAIDDLINKQRETLFWGVLVIPFIVLGSIRGAALRGFGNVVQGQVPEMTIQPITLLMLIIAYSFLFDPIAPIVMMLNAIAWAIAFVTGIFMLNQATPKAIKYLNAEYKSKLWFKSALPLALISGMQIINNHADIVSLGIFATKVEVGVYRVASQSASIVSFSLLAVNMVLAPIMTKLYASGELARLERILIITSRVTLLIALPVVVAFVFWGGDLVVLVYGLDYKESYWPLIILTFGQFVNIAMGSVGYLLSMTGHEGHVARGILIGVVVNVLLNVILVPLYGMLGAAIATSVSMVTWNILLYLKIRKLLKIDCSALGLSLRAH